MWFDWVHHAITSAGPQDAFRPPLLDAAGKLSDTFLARVVQIGSDAGAGDTALELGVNRSADGSAFVDLVSTAGEGDYNARFIRSPGVNGNTQIVHKGTGQLALVSVSNAPIRLYQSGTNRFEVNADGVVALGLAPAGEAQAARLKTFGGITVAQGAVATICPAFAGIVFVICTTEASCAIFCCTVGLGLEMADPQTLYSHTAGTATSHNIYVTGGNLVIQNNRAAGSRSYHFFLFGSSGSF